MAATTRLARKCRGLKPALHFAMLGAVYRGTLSCRPGVTRSARSKWRLAKARPDPDFRYRSNSVAWFVVSNSIEPADRHGRYFAVGAEPPALWSASLKRTSAVS